MCMPSHCITKPLCVTCRLLIKIVTYEIADILLPEYNTLVLSALYYHCFLLRYIVRQRKIRQVLVIEIAE